MMLNGVTARTSTFVRFASLAGNAHTTSKWSRAPQAPCTSTERMMTMQEVNHQILDWIRKDSDPLPARPKSITGLKPRTMADSYVQVLVPLYDPDVKIRYHNALQGLRIGRLLEDLDIVGLYSCFRHTLEDLKQTRSSLIVVTTKAHDTEIRPGDFEIDDCSLKLAGNVCWVGRSSMEVPMTVSLRNNTSGDESVIMKAFFVYSARNPTDYSAAVVNPLIATSPEEEKIMEVGKARAMQRKSVSSESLLKSPPSREDSKLIHSLFVETLYPESLSLTERKLPPNCVWMDSTKSTNTYPATTDSQNIYGKVFGGYLMRGALEKAFTVAVIFSEQPVRILYIDDIDFRLPVDLRTLLNYTAEIAYTEGNVIQVRVQIDVNMLVKKFTTNTLHFTFKCEKDVPRVMPKTYGEYLLYLEGRERFKEATQKQQN